MKLFGYRISREADREENRARQSTIQVIEDQPTDGALEIGSGASGFFNYGIAFDNAPVDEAALITKYRELSRQPEVEKAIDDIINEAFAYDQESSPIEIDLSNVDLPTKTKKLILEEYESILKMLDFKNNCYEIFWRWYVDGRLYYQKVINDQAPKDGIIELRYIDPRKIKKVREELKTNQKVPAYATLISQSFEVNKKFIEYYIYNPQGINPKSPQGIPISPDSITYIHSSILDKTNSTILSHLNKAIKPYNALRMMEDALVIYRLVRAPERRVFNIEVGNLPKMKAEQYLSEIMKKYNRRLKFDPETGQVSDDRRIMTMLEDFWFPKRNGQGTSVETLPGGQTLGQIEDVDYMRRKLYEALNVPISRLDSETSFNLGRSSEITRDELKFTKFVGRLRNRFKFLFMDILEDQLIFKNILSSVEWEKIKDDIIFDFIEDNHFTELKMSELWSQRIANLRDIEPYIGHFFSREFARSKILHITETDWIQMKKEMEDEKDEPPLPMQNQPGFGGGFPGDPSMMGDPSQQMGGGFPPTDQSPFQPQEEDDEEEKPRRPNS